MRSTGSPLDGDGLVRAEPRRLLDLGPQVLARLLLQDVEVPVVAHLEDLGGRAHAQGVALAEVEVHGDPHVPPPVAPAGTPCTRTASEPYRRALPYAARRPTTEESEAMRNLEQGGVKIDGATVVDKALKVEAGTYVVQVGKRRFAKVSLS